MSKFNYIQWPEDSVIELGGWDCNPELTARNTWRQNHPDFSLRYFEVRFGKFGFYDYSGEWCSSILPPRTSDLGEWLIAKALQVKGAVVVDEGIM